VARVPSSADVQVLRAAQEDISSLVVRDLRAMFRSLDLSRPDASAAALREFVPVLVSTYGDMAASLAADWYDEVRASAGIAGRFRASMSPSPYLDAAEPMARRAAGALFTATPSDALVTLEGAVGKYALAAARETIATSSYRDPQSSGWHREVRAGGCDFCKMLAGRPGDVYKESTAHFAAHDHCNCVAVQSWDASAREVPVDVYKASERTTKLRDRAAQGDESAVRQLKRHNDLIRRAIDQYVK